MTLSVTSLETLYNTMDFAAADDAYSAETSPTSETSLAELSLTGSSAGVSTPATSIDEPKESVVQVPDLFSSIMSSEPQVNPNYFRAKQKADTWIVK